MRISKLIKKIGKIESDKLEEVVEPSKILIQTDNFLKDYINFENLNKGKEIYNDVILTIKNYMNNTLCADRSEYKITDGINGIISKITKEIMSNNNEIMLLTVKSTPEDYIYSHIANTTILAAYLSFSLGYSEDEINYICLTGFLHDIGMFALKNIYNKPGKLVESELVEIRKHPVLTKNIIEKFGINIESVLTAVLHIHERKSGKGYPMRLSGEDIHEFARIYSLVDVYEAMTHHRVYRKKIEPHKVLRNLVEDYSDHFEQHLLKKLIDRISLYPAGSFIVLNTGEISRVIKVNEGFPTRPVVEVILDSNKGLLPEPKFINLAEVPLINIKETVDWHKLNIIDKKLMFKLSMQDWWLS